MKINKLAQVCKILTENGFGDEWLDAEHDQIFFLSESQFDSLPEDAKIKLKELGCSIDENGDLYTFC